MTNNLVLVFCLLTFTLKINLTPCFFKPMFQLLINGLGKIDTEDWKLHTRLKHCTPDSNIVKWFWIAVETFDEEKRARLLQFVTGTSKVPLQGFKALQGMLCTDTDLGWSTCNKF